MSLLKKHIPNLLLTTLLTLLLAACSPQDKSTVILDANTTDTLRCIADQSHCQFELASGQVQVLFDVDKIVAEQPFAMVLNYQGAETLTNINGYIEGADMFMGKIPLFFTVRSPVNDKELNNQNSSTSALGNLQSVAKTVVDRQQENNQAFNAEVLLGSCSAEQMAWRIWLTFTTSNHNTYSKMLTVVSYRS